jgi:hypothetical protein
VNALTVDLLSWLDSREVSYAEAIEAWHSHCPRLTIWEDALADGLIRIERGVVTVTELGRAQLPQQ